MTKDEMTCGQEMAADAEIPATLARLMSHVATNMEVHATWVGASASGQREHDCLMEVARAYRAIAEAASRAALAMRQMKPIPAVPHDPSRVDRAGQAQWMRAKIEMQLDFAQMLTTHAELSRQALTELERLADRADNEGDTPDQPPLPASEVPPVQISPHPGKLDRNTGKPPVKAATAAVDSD